MAPAMSRTLVAAGATSLASARLLQNLGGPATSRMSLAIALWKRGYATPSGPPPPGFRMKRPVLWDEEKESTLDRLGRIFLLTEMFRGMYVLMEQFFRAP